jgi:hypothetical protein
MAQDLAAFQRKIDGVIKEFDGTAGKQRLQRVAVQTKKDVDEAVRGDLGDLSMSGWRRGRPIEVRGRFEVVSDHEFEVKPAKRATGPMRVLEEGRNAGGRPGGFQGPGVNRKTGGRNFTSTGKVAKTRSRKARRYNGQTRGKDTWTDAVHLMEQRVPGRVDKEVVKALGRYLGKG